MTFDFMPRHFILSINKYYNNRIVQFVAVANVGCAQIQDSSQNSNRGE
jgi:hypothetical protein